MPRLTIDTRKPGSKDNGSPYVELYYTTNSPVSLIQRESVRSIDAYKTVLYDVTAKDVPPKSRYVRVLPTTIALDDNYEIDRWEGPTHADDIREVLDAW